MTPELVKGQRVSYADEDWRVKYFSQREKTVALIRTIDDYQRVVNWSSEIAPYEDDIFACIKCDNIYLIATAFTVHDDRGTSKIYQECRKCRKIRPPKMDWSKHPHLYKGETGFNGLGGRGKVRGTFRRHAINTRIMFGKLDSENKGNGNG